MLRIRVFQAAQIFLKHCGKREHEIRRRGEVYRRAIEEESTATS